MTSFADLLALKEAIYECWKCGTKMQPDITGEGALVHPFKCQRCGSKYMTWVNYEKMFGGENKCHARPSSIQAAH